MPTAIVYRRVILPTSEKCIGLCDFIWENERLDHAPARCQTYPVAGMIVGSGEFCRVLDLLGREGESNPSSYMIGELPQGHSSNKRSF